jgi:hypothetical protein
VKGRKLKIFVCCPWTAGALLLGTRIQPAKIEEFYRFFFLLFENLRPRWKDQIIFAFSWYMIKQHCLPYKKLEVLLWSITRKVVKGTLTLRYKALQYYVFMHLQRFPCEFLRETYCAIGCNDFYNLVLPGRWWCKI